MSFLSHDGHFFFVSTSVFFEMSDFDFQFTDVFVLVEAFFLVPDDFVFAVVEFFFEFMVFLKR